MRMRSLIWFAAGLLAGSAVGAAYYESAVSREREMADALASEAVDCRMALDRVRRGVTAANGPDNIQAPPAGYRIPEYLPELWQLPEFPAGIE